MRSASPPPARAPASHPAFRPFGGRSHASIGAVSLCLALLVVPSIARAQALRGALDARETAKPDDPTRSNPQAQPPAATVTSDLLGLGDVASPITPTTTDGANESPLPNETGQDETRTGTIDPTTGARRKKPVAGKARPNGTGPVTPVTATARPEGTGPILATTATQPAMRDTASTTAVEAAKEDEAYTPLGLRTGGMIWSPAVEVGVGGKSNVDSARGGRSSTVITVEPELVGRSDWSRHKLEVSLRGGLSAYNRAPDQSRVRYAAEARGTIELGDLTRVDLSAAWNRQRESTSATEVASGGSGTDRETKTLGIGLTRDVGLVGLTLRGEMARSDYFANGTLAAGTTSPSIQNNTLWTAAFRTTLGPTRSIAPFVEVQAVGRRYDAGLVYGLRRDGEGAAAKIGVAIDTGPTLRGEIATGWGFEKPAEASLSTLSGWVIDGRLTWSPSRLVVVKTQVKTSFDPTTNSGSPGAIARAWTVDLDWALRRDLTASLGGGYNGKHYFGIDVDERTTMLSAGLTYKFDRTFQTFVRAKVEHVTASNAPTYDVGTVMTGIRIQR